MSQRFESNYPLDPKQIEEWVDTFNRQGFLFLKNVLTEAHVSQLKAEFEWAIDNNHSAGNEPDDQLRTNPNRTDKNRYITQVSYARRFIGHKCYPFMNYTMPEQIYKDANPRLKCLLGFLEHGAYG